MAGQKRWFLLDDDQELESEWQEIGKELASDPIVARCVEDGIAQATEHAKDVCIAFVDLMLPLSRDNLDLLDTLVLRRNKLTKHQLTELRIINDEISQLIDVNGGIRFVEALKNSTFSKWKIFLFSSRTPTAELKNKVPSAIQWIQKPVDPDELVELLAAHIHE